MSVLSGFIPFTLMGFLYVWYLRLAAKWTLKISLNRKLAWIFVLIAIAISIANRSIFSLGVPVAIGATIGVLVHFAVGVLFFGYFAVDEGRNKPGVIGGAKLIAVAMSMMLITMGLLLVFARLMFKIGNM